VRDGEDVQERRAGMVLTHLCIDFKTGTVTKGGIRCQAG